MKRSLLTCLWLLAVTVSPLGAQNPSVSLPERAALPAQGSQPWGEDTLKGAVLPPDAASKVNLRPVTDHGTELSSVIELSTDQPFTGATYQLQLSLPSRAPLTKGTTVFVEFYMRLIKTKTETGEGLTAVVIEKAGGPFTKSLNVNVTAPSDGSWVRRSYAAVIAEDYAPGKAQINFHMGFSHPQAIQIGGLRVVDLGAGVDPKSLPVTRPTYVGRDASAPWRAKAAERIEKHRKGDLAIRVLDARGKPVPNATVSVQMTKPDFAFGSAVASDMLIAEGPDGDRYRAWIKDNCSRVVIENHLKMSNWEVGLRRETGVAWQNATTLKSLAWLKENNLEIRGHTLVWPSWRFSPKRLKDLAGDPAALKKAYDDHIVQILAATAPYDLVEWDVVNESFTQRDALDVLGDGVMTDWFKLAREHFPKGGLFYNDFGHLQSSRGNTTPFTRHIESVVKNLKAQGAPITGYGIQAHIGEGMPSSANVMEELDRLGTEFDLDLAITEFDLGVTDDQVHADYTRDFLTACFASPRVRTFMAWGFWEGRHWIPRAAMIRKDWTERPATKVWNDLFKKEWWTNLTGTTDADGAWKGRGFRGLHEVKITFKNPATGKLEERTAKVEIGQTAQEVSVMLP